MEKIFNPGELNKRITLVTNKIVNGEVIPQQVIVWANKSSVKRSEFYASYQVGLSPQTTLTIRQSAYELSAYIDADGIKHYASMVKIGAAEYNIIRTYETDDFVELICG
jgi:hypothetical protein